MKAWSQRISFRTRLTTWWTLVFGLILAVASIAVYAAFRNYLVRDLDLKVRTVAATELGSSTDGATIHLHELPTAALASGEYTDKFVQILEADGRLRLFSASLGGMPPLVSPAIVRAAIDGQAPVVTVTIAGRPGRAAVLGASKGSARYAVVVGIFRDQIDAHLAQLAWVLVAVWIAGLGATSVVGSWLASRALTPVVQITHRAARIARGEFSVRLDPPASEDEVGEMTRSLNEVLERLHGALEAHRRFAADASHELRAPIAAMMGELDVALKHARTADEYRDTLLIVGDRLRTLAGLCEDLILLVHAQEGAQDLDLREIPVLPHLQDGANRLAGPLASRAITIEARALPDLVAYADPRLLARVFDNVLANAVHYNRDGGAIVISGSAEESAPDEWRTGAAVITVSDTGGGIPPAEAERVFDRFYRVDRSRARQSGGSGLGLAICREALRVLGGSIRITASGPGGTTFEIRIPGRVASERCFTEALASNPGPLGAVG